MFENTVAYKRIMKRKLLTEAVEKAKEEGIDWKIRQSESKLACFNKKYYPNIALKGLVANSRVSKNGNASRHI